MWVSLVIGFLIGIVSSFLVWWFVLRILVPKISFSESISKTKTKEEKSGYRYRLKIENSGRRGIIDVDLVCKLRLKGVYPGDGSNWQVVTIPVRNKWYIRIRPTRKNKLREVVRLEMDKVKIDNFDKDIYPEEIRQKCREGTLLLEDLLSLGTERTFWLVLMGYDEFSGSRKVFISKSYDLAHIKLGKFDPNGLEVIQDSDHLMAE